MSRPMKQKTVIEATKNASVSGGVTRPLVSIGLPVFNGEAYLVEALDSLLEQTFRDFELIISDNGSTDSTSIICKSYAERDSRICYIPQERNRGAAWNFNHVFEKSVGRYFMWAAHDDLWHRQYLEKCVAVLEKHREFILCYAATQEITGEGNPGKKNSSVKVELASPRASTRFAASWHFPPQVIAFSLMRREVLERTGLIGDYSAADQVLVTELSMAGPMYGLSRYLFFYRRHKRQSTADPFPTMRSRNAWYNPQKTSRLTFPWWSVLKNHMKVITLAPVGMQERLLCYCSLLRWIIGKRQKLINELIFRDVPSPKRHGNTA